jgi:hypothetical protein
MDQNVRQCLEGINVVKDWNAWRGGLKEAIASAGKMGISEQEMQNIAVRMGDFLAEKICPATKEEELLKEMWDSASQDERKTLASVIFKLMK